MYCVRLNWQVGDTPETPEAGIVWRYVGTNDEKIILNMEKEYQIPKKNDNLNKKKTK